MNCGSWVSNCWVFPSSNKQCFMKTSGIFISHPLLERHLTKPKSLFPIDLKISSLNNKGILSGLKWQTHLQTIRAVEREYVISNSSSDLKFDSKLEFGKDESDKSSDLDEKEKMRRLKIGKANSGNIPWNKGRKHSPETLQKIRERTRLAMNNPKVKVKLGTTRQAWSEERKVKAGQKVREGWKKRREKLMVQKRCIFEWQNSIAELAKLGFSGQDELQWNSYELIQSVKKEAQKVEQVWERRRENLMRELRKSTVVNKRAPKSTPQKTKIAEAIRAKWADPDYRERAQNGMMRYHAQFRTLNPKSS